MTVEADSRTRAEVWNTDVWFCHANPARRVIDVILDETPRIYKNTVDEYLKKHKTVGWR